MTLDLLFPVQGEDFPTDHAYPLYAALSSLIPEFHAPESSLRFAPLAGVTGSPGRLQTGPSTRLRIRLSDSQIRLALPLAGQQLVIAGSRLRLGVPSVTTLTPATTLLSRIVTFKNACDPVPFLDHVRASLQERGIIGEPSIPVVQSGTRAGEPRRRVVRIKGKAIVGYSLVISGLSATDSLTLQEQGLGGRTRMGCGFFLTMRG